MNLASGTGIVLFIVAIVISVWVGTKTKVNVGILGFFFAMFLGSWLGGMSIGNVVNQFPSAITFLLIVVSFFYGFPSKNGAMRGLADRMMYACRNRPGLIPIMTLVMSVVVTTLGAGADAGPMFISPICFALAAAVGFDPMLALMACCFGTSFGGKMPWCSGGAMYTGVYANTLPQNEAAALHLGGVLTIGLAMLITFMLCYFKTGGNKLAAQPDMKKPEPFTAKQRFCILFMACAIAVIIIPGFIQSFVGSNPVSSWMLAKFDIKFIAVVGIIVFTLTDTADAKDVFKNAIPWGLIITIAGMMMLVNVAKQVGIVDYASELVANFVPQGMLKPVMFLIGAALSFVASGASVIAPLLMPMGTSLAATFGFSEVLFDVSWVMGFQSTVFSPFSQGGASALVGCPDELRASIYPKQIIWTFVLALISFVLYLLGVGDLLVGLML